LLLAVGCTDNNTGPALRVNPRDFGVPREAATYTVAVTSDASWTAAISWNPSWLSISSPVSGSGDGSITVSVDENNTFFPRTASLKVTSGDVSRAMDLTQQGFPKPDAPANAASPNTWIFGTQLWSDMIQVPDCNTPITEYIRTFASPQCASNTVDGVTYYFYNRVYVVNNATSLCPDPWRVPTYADLETLVASVPQLELRAAWGLPGYAFACKENEAGCGTHDAYGEQLLMFAVDRDGILYNEHTVGENPYLSHGIPVRCVVGQ
jgi:hypothetical protein